MKEGLTMNAGSTNKPAHQSTDTDEPVSAPAYDSQTGYDLEIAIPGQPPQRVPLVRTNNIIGRQDGCHIVINLNLISRKHCCIFIGQQIFIRDMGDTQGTAVNGKLLTGQDFVEISLADEIQIATVVLRIRLRE